MNIGSDRLASSIDITNRYETTASITCERLARNQRVRRNLPEGGRLRFDRQLPFLCLFRGDLTGLSNPANHAPNASHNLASHQNDASARELITSEAAYVFASDRDSHHRGLSNLCGMISSSMQEHFGTFLLIEVWERDTGDQDTDTPDFEVIVPSINSIASTTDTLCDALRTIRISGRTPVVVKTEAEPAEARGLPELAALCEDTRGACCYVGIVVRPFYRDHIHRKIYPLAFQGLRGKLARVIRKTVAEFTGSPSGKAQPHYDHYGPSSMVKAARLVDQQLCEVADSFDYLLQVTPVNADAITSQIDKTGQHEEPPMQYRHLPHHPNILKRRLFDIEIERVEDPTLAHLFWEKQDEIDRQLTSLRDLHSPELALHDDPQPSNFLTSSLQLYGSPEPSLVKLAAEILERIPKRVSPPKKTETSQHGVDADTLMQAAREEIDYYHARMTEFNATVERDDSIASGIMVSKDKLLVSPDVSISRERLAPLLHHEIGTHLLTYFNGRCQPFRQLHGGLARYEELQEGLAVLAEYLVGGLTQSRLRTLAARVLAVDWMVEGRSFRDVLGKLQTNHDFSLRQATTITVRVFRGGGLTKDMIYLRGLRDLLDYLSNGHDLEPLYVGKIGLHHVPYIQELRRRGVILPPRILPRFLEDDAARQRLDACRGKSVIDLLENTE
ncbi:flavohemoglobin expression-modulating QEGLA motif protein [Rhodopirellula sallentina]|uniref:Protein containing DUF1704 n=1 Tax=Rhodopirellula sallentina SM41 TaxID=1263870 RepID=M5UCR1_9BACT|nr:tyrosine/phenylalanine carboxypeptidase domain-containing protein [Rhodopirellula sallentina]EMI55651.1 protein containing DUF1704 [Rhodopirellula sallentina SM41]